jgi:hypothetical protein
MFNTVIKGVFLLFLTTLTLVASDTKANYAPSSALQIRALGGTVSSALWTSAAEMYNGANLTADHDTYTPYGCGAASFPARDSWIGFQDMWDINLPMMLSSCTQFGQVNNGPIAIEAIWNGIIDAATTTGLDARFILATMMQESGGCVRVPTTNYGTSNPGLLQDHAGTASCNDGGIVQIPCPPATISQMISEGAAGTTTGDGLAQCLNEAAEQYGETGAMAFYNAARIYNSGSVGADGCLESGIATHCYACDIANRLTGWVFAEKTCTFDE